MLGSCSLIKIGGKFKREIKKNGLGNQKYEDEVE